jgi:hypothetical protein
MNHVLSRIAVALVSACWLASSAFAGVPIAKPLSSATAAAPAAASFAIVFVSTTNSYAKAHHDPSRIGHADCVQAAPGKYMCSYRTIRPSGSECHLMQARWTPQLASTFTVTLAGRVKQCGTLRQAIRSLG